MRNFSHVIVKVRMDVNPTSRSPRVPIYGVNVMLGGAMMSSIIIMVFLVCYCCNRTKQKREATVPTTYWRDPALSLEVFTIDGQQLFEMGGESPRTISPCPPPDYNSVMNTLQPNEIPKYENVLLHDARRNSTKELISDESGLPSYEDALQIERKVYHTEII